MKEFFGIFGIFDRIAQLREDPLLADIYADVDKLRNSSVEELGAADASRYYKDLVTRSHYIGPERDRENMLKDKRNMARDFNKAFQAAKVRLGV